MKRFFVVLFLSVSSVVSYAQHEDGGIRILDGEIPLEYEPRKLTKKGKIPANVIKFAFLSPFRGDYSLLYERRIFPWFSIQAGAGVTVRDKVYERFTSGVFNSPDFSSAGGFSAKFGLRFYPISDGWMSGLFILPDFVYRQYDLNANLTKYDTDNNASVQKLRCGYSFREYRLLLGQSYDFIFRRLYLEYYVGLVFREINESVPLYQNNDQGAYYTRMDRMRFLPGIAFNASLGYAF